VGCVGFQIVGERDSVPPGALEQIHLGAAQVIDAASISDVLAPAAVRQREVVFATLAEIIARPQDTHLGPSITSTMC
jgi:hypothetical protein